MKKMLLIRRWQRNLVSVSTSWRRIMVLIWKTSPLYVSFLLALTLLTGLLPSIQIQITGHIVQSASDAIQGGKTSQLVSLALFFGLLQGGLAVTALLLSNIQQYVQTLLQLRLTNAISLSIMEKSISLDVQHFEDDALYDMLQRANQESMYRPSQIFTQTISVCSYCIVLVSVTIVLISWNWWLGFFILLAPLPSVCSQLFYSQRKYSIERERSPDRRRLIYLQFLVTHVQAVKELRLFQLGTHFLERYRHLNDGFYETDSRILKRQMLITTPLTLLSSLASAGAQIYVIVITITIGRIGLLAGSIQAIGAVQSSMQMLLDGINGLYQNNLFLTNLFEFLDVPASQIRSGTRAFPDQLRKGIEFRHVSFRYPGTTQMVIEDLTLLIPAGKCVAFVGQNGAGKTTLVKLLSRLYEPTDGHILIDDIPIEDYDLCELRQHIGVIFQDFMHYEMKVRENIGFGSIENLNNDARLAEAVESSRATSIIDALPQGYETILGRMFERGQELSIGQWQKIALARAFMRQAPIIVLDEPTSAVDAAAEAELFERLHHITRKTTTLLIAHRLSSVRMADRILVLKHGRIIEEGTHEELLRKEGTYAQLFKLQAAGYTTHTC